VFIGLAQGDCVPSKVSLKYVQAKSFTSDKVMSILEKTAAVEKIEAEILKLSPVEISQLTDWLTALDAERWDKQMEEDVKAGKLEFLAAEALAEYEAGNCRQI